MKTNWNKIGRLIFSTGILLWVVPLLLKDHFILNQKLSTILMAVGVFVEAAGMVIVKRNGGFSNRFCRKNIRKTR